MYPIASKENCSTLLTTPLSEHLCFYFAEVNEVKLVGTLTSGSHELQPGIKILTVKTKESSNKL